MWHEMEQIYLPWRRWGDLSNEAGGRFLQGQLHIFVSPFYYIDYVLALVCALQFWGSAEKDRQTAMAQYFALCRRGGRGSLYRTRRFSGSAIAIFQRGAGGYGTQSTCLYENMSSPDAGEICRGGVKS